jgi:hypothetical protein
VAEIVEDVDALTELVLTVNVALVVPEAILTLVGTVAAAVLLLASVTTIPDEGAAELSVTLPCDVAPPATPIGFSVNAVTAGVDDCDWAAPLFERTFSSAIEI